MAEFEKPKFGYIVVGGGSTGCVVVSRLSERSQSVCANANFRHYVYGNFCSQFGLWVRRVAVAWLTWELTESPFWLGLMAFADFALAIVRAPLAGARVPTRCSKRKERLVAPGMLARSKQPNRTRLGSR